MRDPIDTASPETAPPPVRTAGRARLARVLRLLLAGSLAIALLDPAHLDDWAGQRPLLAQSSSVHLAIEEADRVLAAFGFPQAYAWLRRQTRAMQGLRFNAGADDRQ